MRKLSILRYMRRVCSRDIFTAYEIEAMRIHYYQHVGK